jgi:hypothetical protein
MSDGIDADSNAGKVENAAVRLPISAGRKAQAVYAELSLPLHAGRSRPSWRCATTTSAASARAPTPSWP